MSGARFGRVLLAALPAVAVVATFASAASLGGLDPQLLAAGDGPIPRCDSAFTIQHATSGGNVVEVGVGDVADACEGGELRLTLTNGAGTVVASGGPASIPTDGDALPASVVVSVTPTPAAENVANAHVSVVGP